MLKLWVSLWMVRLIVGQLVLVGEKKISPEIFTIWINKKNDVKNHPIEVMFC